jgi:putative restriction endonuclease
LLPERFAENTASRSWTTRDQFVAAKIKTVRSPMPSQNWTRDETLAALALYCKLPFGRLHARNPKIVALARGLGRTPSAIAMKCCNLASLDETHTQRGVSGLSKVSRLDRSIWDEFNSDRERLCFDAATALASHTGMSPVTLDAPIVEGRERESVVRVRVNQHFFRGMVLASYGSTCAVCGLAVSRLVVAAHIVPWSADAANRLNPRNGLCLCGTHDLAFEHGILLVLRDCTITISTRFDELRGSEPADTWLFRYDGKRLRSPERWPPDPELLARRQLANSTPTSAV